MIPDERSNNYSITDTDNYFYNNFSQCLLPPSPPEAVGSMALRFTSWVHEMNQGLYSHELGVDRDGRTNLESSAGPENMRPYYVGIMDGFDVGRSFRLGNTSTQALLLDSSGA